MEDEVISLRDGIYTDNKTIQYHGPVIYKKAEYIEKSREFLTKEFDINDRIVLGLKIQDKDYGYISLNGFIYINSKFDLKTNIKTLCHEMTHLKQIKDGRLGYIKNKNRFIIIWENKQYPDISKLPYDEYKEFPWEKEAFDYENKFTLKTIDYLRKQTSRSQNASWSLRTSS